MYATAQRVRLHRLRDEGTEVGINSFCYEHRGLEIAGFSWDEPDVVTVAEHHPGLLVKRSFELVAGVNIVVSYLDVAAQDDTPPDTIEAALREFHNRLGSHPRPGPEVIDKVGIRFSIFRDQLDFIHEEFNALSARVMDIVKAPPDEPPTEDPLTVEVGIDSEGFSYRYDEASGKRVREAQPKKDAPKVSVTVPHTVKMDYEKMHGDIIPIVIQGLADGLSLEQLRLMGGLRFVKAGTNEVLREWP